MKNIKLYLEDGNELELETCFLNEQFLTDERESFQIFHQRCYTSGGQIGSVPGDDRTYFTKKLPFFGQIALLGCCLALDVNFVDQVEAVLTSGIRSGGGAWGMARDFHQMADAVFLLK